MSTTPAHTWTCARCHRRVPIRVEACHCGTTRQQSLATDVGSPREPARAAAAPDDWRGVWRSLPRDVKAMTVVAALVLGAGLGWLVFGPERPAPAPALLGNVDRPRVARRAPAPPRPPFKLPWWK